RLEVLLQRIDPRAHLLPFLARGDAGGASRQAERQEPPHCAAPAVISARRFFAHADSSWPGSAGRSLPWLTTLIRLPSAPSPVRYLRTDSARRWPSARLYSVVPRSSVWPATVAGGSPRCRRHWRSASSVLRASDVREESSNPK